MAQLVLDFDGKTYDRRKDGKRLSTQLAMVRELMLDGRWRTPAEIAAVVQGDTASLTARVRDLRKDKFGGYKVDRRRRYENGGTWEYRVSRPCRQEAPQ